MKKLLELLKNEGGAIRSSNEFNSYHINQARASNRMWVDEDGFGFIWYPPFGLLLPTTPEEMAEWERLEKKYFPLPDDRPIPERLSADKIWEEVKRREEELKKANKN